MKGAPPDAPGEAPDRAPHRKETPIVTNFSLRAARIQLGALLAALVLAILIALGITAGAFVLSFAVQRDLARQAMIPEYLAWIFPVIVDSAIFGSTIAIVLLSKLETARSDKGFYIALACSVVAISILGNAYHAYHAAEAAQARIAAGVDLGFIPLAPTVAALIAVIPPALVLAFTHGIGILIKATGTAYAEYRAQIDLHTDLHDVAPHETVFADFAAGPQNDGGVDAEFVDTGFDVPDVSATNSATDVIPEVVPTDSSEVDLVAELDLFIDTAELPASVKDTARRKLADPTLTWEVIAETSIPPVVTSTAWRRYERFDKAARAAGFANPPLFDMREAEQSVDQLVTVS